MKINETNTIKSIQEAFQKEFAYLKIEFYKQLHAEGEGSAESHITNIDLTITEIQKVKSTGSLEISGDMTVSDVETSIAEMFNIGAQVYRHSGNVWLQTTTTDSLTLKAQTQKAKEFIEEVVEEIPDAMDRQELE
jgi:hypothetical protein